jgi:hypothetical protein
MRHSFNPKGAASEQARVSCVETTHGVIVEKKTPDAAIRRKSAGLWFYLLGSQHAAHRREDRISAKELKVSRELFDPVDVTPPLDFDDDGLARGIPRNNVDRPDRGHVFATHERVAFAEQLDLFGEKPLEISLYPVLLQAGIDPELMARVVQDFVDRDHEQVSCLCCCNFPDLNDARG